MADGELALRAMVASGIGAGILRLDQARQAERNGELRIWNGWRSHTWLCWVTTPEIKRTQAVEAVRRAVLDAWA